jgi:hypothetical protein
MNESHREDREFCLIVEDMKRKLDNIEDIIILNPLIDD